MRKVKSEDFFGLTESELLQDDDRGCTNEENMLSREGRNVTYFDDIAEYEEEKKEQMKEEERRAYEGHDTVCIIGRSRKGSMACGVSTSGLYMKEPGRVGDSPFIGSGFYADSEAGAAAATGMGEGLRFLRDRPSDAGWPSSSGGLREGSGRTLETSGKTWIYEQRNVCDRHG